MPRKSSLGKWETDIWGTQKEEVGGRDGSCEISMTELVTVCQQFVAECLAFLESSEPSATPTCEAVYLGPDIGYANIFDIFVSGCLPF